MGGPQGPKGPMGLDPGAQGVHGIGPRGPRGPWDGPQGPKRYVGGPQGPKGSMGWPQKGKGPMGWAPGGQGAPWGPIHGPMMPGAPWAPWCHRMPQHGDPLGPLGLGRPQGPYKALFSTGNFCHVRPWVLGPLRPLRASWPRHGLGSQQYNIFTFKA